MMIVLKVYTAGGAVQEYIPFDSPRSMKPANNGRTTEIEYGQGNQNQTVLNISFAAFSAAIEGINNEANRGTKFVYYLDIRQTA